LADYPELAPRLARGRRVESVIGVGPLERRVRASAGPGYVLVGDAAGFFDPFTGEGIFRALRGAQLLAQQLDTLADYPAARRQAFGAKERLTAVIQLFVRTPALLELAVRRLQQRPALARALGNVLGDLEPARLRLVWQLLTP
jgi:flavin-dependent dehydrogenase